MAELALVSSLLIPFHLDPTLVHCCYFSRVGLQSLSCAECLCHMFHCCRSQNLRLFITFVVPSCLQSYISPFLHLPPCFSVFAVSKGEVVSTSVRGACSVSAPLPLCP